MNVLLIGAGGREHALAWKLAQSPLIDALFVAPGNPGTARVGRNLPVEVLDIPRLVEVAQRERVELVVIGPEAPLAAGLADAASRQAFRSLVPLRQRRRSRAAKPSPSG